MKEAAFQKRITDMATRFGWKWWWTPAPMVKRGDEWVGAKQAAGVSDLILMHDDPPRLVFMEVKGDGGRLSDEQQEFLQAAKLVAAASVIARDDDEFFYDAHAPIGVMAVWPKDEAAVEQMLRSKVVA